MDFYTDSRCDNLLQPTPPRLAVESNFMQPGVFQKMLSNHIAVEFMKVIFVLSIRCFNGHVQRTEGRASGDKEHWRGGDREPKRP